MKQSHRLALQNLAPILDGAGVKWRVQQGGKHLCIVITDREGHEHKMPVSGSPRDGDAVLNHQRQQCQRLLERIGVRQDRGVQGQCSRHRPKGPPPPRVTVLTFDRPDMDAGPYRDPWAVLRESRA